jgi:hypothetical protein
LLGMGTAIIMWGSIGQALASTCKLNRFIRAGYPPQNIFALLTRGAAALNWSHLSDSGCVRYVRSRNNRRTSRDPSDAA